MSRRVRGKVDGATALAAAVALVVVLFASTGALAGVGGTSGEACFSCALCESGECGDGDENPLTSHHHCCMMSCFSHAPVAFSSRPTASAPVVLGPIVPSEAVHAVSRVPETPYRPPRV